MTIHTVGNHIWNGSEGVETPTVDSLVMSDCPVDVAKSLREQGWFERGNGIWSHEDVEDMMHLTWHGAATVQMSREPRTPSVVPKGLRAWSDFQDHVLVRIGNVEHGMDIMTATRLLRDLKVAVDNAAGYDPA